MQRLCTWHESVGRRDKAEALELAKWTGERQDQPADGPVSDRKDRRVKRLHAAMPGGVGNADKVAKREEG
jgi:hypothetical protein